MALICAATGHRPDKLGGYGPDAEERLRHIAGLFLDTCTPTSVITGMALGWDMAWAEAALLRGIPVTAAVPFIEQPSQWPQASRDRWSGILATCTHVEYVGSPGYAAWKMDRRNRWMVDNCHMLVALWDGSDGGTANCVRYGRRLGRETVNLWPWLTPQP